MKPSDSLLRRPPEGLVAALNLLQGVPHLDPATRALSAAYGPDGAPSVGSALAALLEDARVGRLSATSPGDRWLVPRISEALRGFDEIQQMDTGDEPLPSTYAGVTADTASIRAERVGALTPA